MILLLVLIVDHRCRIQLYDGLGKVGFQRRQKIAFLGLARLEVIRIQVPQFRQFRTIERCETRNIKRLIISFH